MNYSLFTPTELQTLLENYIFALGIKKKKKKTPTEAQDLKVFSSDLEPEGIANTEKTAPTVLSLGRAENRNSNYEQLFLGTSLKPDLAHLG